MDKRLEQELKNNCSAHDWSQTQTDIRDQTATNEPGLKKEKKGQTMHIMAVTTVSDNDKFWGSLKKGYDRLPKGAKWVLAVARTDGTKAVNIIVHDSIDRVKSFFEEHTASFGTTEYFEADAANAVGLPKPFDGSGR